MQPTQHQLKGYTFIEVAISLFLLSVALLGLNAMHLRALRDTKIADCIVTANQQLVNLSERLATLNSDRELPEIVNTWNDENHVSLPLGFGIVSGKFPEYAATLFWGTRQITCEPNHFGLSGCLRETIRVAFH